VKKSLLYIVLLVILPFHLMGQVLINEICIANYSDYNIPSGGNNFEDWIELYNPSATAVDISGYWLSDNAANPQKWAFPAGTTVAANGYRVVLLTGRGSYQPTFLGGLNTNFKLNQTAGEEIVFSNSGGVVLETYDFDTMTPNQSNHSWGRVPNGSSTWRILTNPSENAANPATGATAYAAMPTMDLQAGYYPNAINVNLSTLEPGGTIYYTLDGTAPSNTSTLYTGAINIATTKVLRAIVYSADPNVLPSLVETNTYFFGADNHSILTVSVSGNNMNGQWPGAGNNRLTTIEFFNAGGTFITENHGDSNEHGNDSNAYGQRGFDYIGRDELGYDHTVQDALFPERNRDDYDRLIFKAAANDNYPFSNGGAHIRDAYVCQLSILGDLHLDERATRSCIVYLNGNYWGVYEVREKIDDTDYTSKYYNQERGQIDYLKTWGGTWAEYDAAPAFNATNNWNTLRNFITTNNMAVQANYDYAISQYNHMSLIDYFILNGYTVCTDWLNWNTQWWRGYNPNGDARRWRYALWDNDATFGHYVNYTGVPSTAPTADPCQTDGMGNVGGQGHIPILNSLFDNPEFLADYVQRYAELTNGVFSCQYMLAVLDSMIAVIEPEMPRQIVRWGGTMAEWQSNVQDLRNFILARCPEETSNTDIIEGMEDCYDVTQQTLTVQISGPGSVMLEETSIDATNAPYQGTFFSGNTVDLPIEIIAIPSGTGSCSDFIQWVVVSGTAVFDDPMSDTTTLVIGSDAVIEAQFGTGNTGPVNFVLNSNPALSANIDWNGNLQTVLPVTMIENGGTAVTAEAVPNPGFVFDHWESNFTALMPDQDSIQLNLLTCLDDTLTAVLLPVYNVTIQVTGSGSSTIDGVDASTFSGSFLSTDVIDIAAIENGPCGLFIDWEVLSGSAVIANTGSLNTTMTISSDVVIQVNFTSLPAGMVEVVITSPYPDAGGFSLNGNNYSTYPQTLMLPPGVPLDLEAFEADWYDFVSWNSTFYSFTPSANVPATSLTVCSADTLTVNYNFTPHQLVTITKTPMNIGQVFVDGVEVFNLPVTYDWAEGENHSVGALTLAPWTSFVEWQSSGLVLNPNTTSSTVNFMVTEQDTVIAVFYEIPHSLITVVVDEPYTALATATGGGSSNYAFQFEVENGVPVTFSSTVNEFYDFKNLTSAQGNFISPSFESEEIVMTFEANDTITLHTIPEIYSYYIPNSFSPNGDNVNDCIGPVGNAVQIDRFSWVVFNRNGELVFETDDFGDCWDGSHLGGEYYVPDGVYTYVLRVKSVFDKEIQKVTGSIIVVR
jgi:gliding motility-associated-like protein